MKARLYIDEDAMHSALVQALRIRGVDVTSVGEQRMQGYSDEQQLQFATVEGRALYTFNVKDYVLLHTTFLEQGLSHAGIIVAEQHRHYSVGEQMRRLLRLLAAMSAEEMRNQIIYLGAWG